MSDTTLVKATTLPRAAAFPPNAWGTDNPSLARLMTGLTHFLCVGAAVFGMLCRKRHGRRIRKHGDRRRKAIGRATALNRATLYRDCMTALCADVARWPDLTFAQRHESLTCFYRIEKERRQALEFATPDVFAIVTEGDRIGLVHEDFLLKATFGSRLVLDMLANVKKEARGGLT